ncbi:MAG: hypothetical protein HZC02_02765 [Candidatus Levybacteria bacterium]|nr:hypothetical protein [Candidatus Levybacteria bacterium]
MDIKKGLGWVTVIVVALMVFTGLVQTFDGGLFSMDSNARITNWGGVGNALDKLIAAKTGEEPVTGDSNEPTGGSSQQAASNTSGATVGQTTTGGTTDSNAGSTVIQSQSTINTTTTITSNGSGAPQILTADQAQAWCTAGPCEGRFEGLKEANGVMNPKGVHLKTGSPVSLSIPAGVNGQVWDCFNASEVTGPATLPQVCEATFRLQ